MNSSPFTVIGVMQKKTQTSAYGGQDRNHVVIPITTFRALFGRDKVNVVVLHTETEDEMDDAIDRMKQFFAAKYSFDPKDERVFGIWNTVKGQRISAKIFLGMEMFFGIIGALTLIIGCVGVANIMYAVVKERTREIGVKMALGARRGWITGPFILEGLAYTLVGGFAGAAIAITIVTLLGMIPKENLRSLELHGRTDALVADRRRDGRDPRNGRPARRLLPGAPRRRDRPGLDVEVRMSSPNQGAAMAVPETDTIIEMQAIRKIYDTGKVKVEALKGIDLLVTAGEFVAIVGPSGSGKSTLMNLIGCLDTPTDGRYRLGGEDVAKLDRDELADVRNRRVGFVFQGFNLLPQISAFENVEMPLVFGGVAVKERRDRVAELLGRVGLSDRMDHKPTELSGGQMQRVAIARALAMRPDVVLADEPTGNLDTSAGGDIMELFSDLWKQGRTLVVITHDMTLARRAGRIVEVRDGRIISDTAWRPRKISR